MHSLCKIAKISETEGKLHSKEIVALKFRYFSNLFESPRVCDARIQKLQCSNVSTTPVTATGCQQCLLLSVVQLKDKHCRKPHCRNGVVGTFEQCHVQD